MSSYSRWDIRLRKLESRLNVEKKINIEFVNDYSFIVNGDRRERFYRPSPTAWLFHQAHETRREIMGPFASGKTTACMADIIINASKMPRWSDGVRRSKWAIIRNTASQLETTTLATWLSWYRDLDINTPYRKTKPVLRYVHRYSDNKDDSLVELEILFLPLARIEDLEKIKSLDLTGAYINESSTLPHEVFEVVHGRTGRYPPQNMNTYYWNGVNADTNPPKRGHWIYENFFKNPLPDHAFFKQPPALLPNPDTTGHKWITNPNAENLERMGDYWLNKSIGATDEYVNVFCLGEFGTIAAGKLVFPEYNDDLHSRPTLEANPGLPLILSFDFGLTPACLIVQQSITGKIYGLRECFVKGAIMGLTQFIETIVVPTLNKYFPDFDVEWVTGDPAGTKRMDTDENDCFNILRKYWPGRCEPSVTNKISSRLESVRRLFSQLIDGEPRFVFSREGCPVFREGMLGNYIFKEVTGIGEKAYHDEPLKNEYSHIQDAFQYIAIYITNLMGESKSSVDVSKFITRGLRF